MGFHRERLCLGSGYCPCSLEAAPTAGSGQHKPLCRSKPWFCSKPSLPCRAGQHCLVLVPEPSLRQLMDVETIIAFRERDLSTGEGKEGGRVSCSEWRGGQRQRIRGCWFRQLRPLFLSPCSCLMAQLLHSQSPAV